MIATNAIIQPAALEDAEAIAYVHVESWRSTYRDIIPSEYLAQLSLENRKAMWTRAIREPSHGSSLFVAKQEFLGIIGFASCGPSRSPELGFDGEIEAIYLMEAHQGVGLGRHLFTACVYDLLKGGFTSMMLWVLQDNRACDFYRHMGGSLCGRKTESIGGKTFVELAFGWGSLANQALG